MEETYDIRNSQCRGNSKIVNTASNQDDNRGIINGFLLDRIYGWSIRIFRAILRSVSQFLISIDKRSTDPKPTNSYDVQSKIELVQTDH